jgi:transcriptional regulator with XRE-family HTH domain
MNNLLTQIKNRRQQLGFRQSDMPNRLGMSRQQYQRLESKGNPRLETLELIAKGLNAELLLIPKEQVAQVRRLLEKSGQPSTEANTSSLVDDPWQGLLDTEETSDD